MPTIRTSLNAEWKPHRPSSAITSSKRGSRTLPHFIWDKLIDQLLLPHLRSSIANWDAKSSRWSLESRPLPLATAARRRSVARCAGRGKNTSAGRVEGVQHPIGPSRGLSEWRIFTFPTTRGDEWEALLLSTVVPRLASHLEGKVDRQP